MMADHRADFSLRPKPVKQEAMTALILERIRSGEWEPGERVPAMRDLTSSQGVSLGPVRGGC